MAFLAAILIIAAIGGIAYAIYTAAVELHIPRFKKPVVVELNVTSLHAELRIVHPESYHLDVVIHGPDGRYNPGRSSYGPAAIYRLRSALSSAIERARSLAAEKIGHDITIQLTRDLALRLSDQEALILFYASSPTRRLSRALSIEDAIELEAALGDIPSIIKEVTNLQTKANKNST